MKKETVEKLAPHIGTTVSSYRAGWAVMSCPFGPWRHESGKDAHPSFGIKVNPTKPSICKCFSCGFGGDLTDLLLELGIEYKKSPSSEYDLSKALEIVSYELDELEFDTDIPDYKQGKSQTPTFFEYPEWWLHSFPFAIKFTDAKTYLWNRGISLEHAKELDLRYDAMQKRVCFPFRDFKGRLAGMQGRAVDPKKEPRYYFYDYGEHKNMQVWLGEHTINLDRPVVLVEGPFDYASVHRVYKNVLASFSAGISVEKLQRVGEAREIITFYDHGKGGDQARKRIRKVLKGTPILDLIPSEFFGDPGATPLDEIIEMLQNHVKLDSIPDDVM